MQFSEFPVDQASEKKSGCEIDLPAPPFASLLVQSAFCLGDGTRLDKCLRRLTVAHAEVSRIASVGQLVLHFSDEPLTSVGAIHDHQRGRGALSLDAPPLRQ